MANNVTIFDIANMAQVSTSTVSLVLSGKRPISQPVRERVLKIIADTGYRPRHTAQAFVQGRTGQIGIVLYEISNSETIFLLECIERELSEQRYNLLLTVTGGSRERAEEIFRDFSSGKVDGVINMLSFVSINQAKLWCGNTPTITYMRPHPDSPVWIDRASGALLMMEHLWSLGHRRIGYITHVEDDVKDLPLEFAGNSGGLSGYRRFYSRIGLECEENLIFYGDSRFSSGQQGAELLFKQGTTAIFSDNDVAAMGILNWAYEKRLRIPDDLTVVSGDDSPMAQMSSPPLTTVHFPAAQAAQLTIQGLIRIIKGEQLPSRQTVLDCKLVIRQSSAPPKSKFDVKKKSTKNRITKGLFK